MDRNPMSQHFKKVIQRSGTVAAFCLFALAGSNAASAGVKVGVLECTLGVGVGVVIAENQKVDCTFKPNSGPEEHYGGQITKIGLELGITGGTVVIWGVIAATNEYTPGSLAGVYGGATAEATAILGVGANALWGGSDQSLALQPISVQGQTGVDIGIGLSGMTLVQK
jgi:Protein of unknown function (DUF992)